MRKTHFQGGPAKPSGPNLFYIPSHFPCTFKAQERKVPSKKTSQGGTCRRLLPELARVFIRFADPSQVPSTGIPDIGSLAHSDSFRFFFIIIYKQEKKRKTKKQINFLKIKSFIWEFPKIERNIILLIATGQDNL
jgi:hypothetical protein